MPVDNNLKIAVCEAHEPDKHVWAAELWLNDVLIKDLVGKSTNFDKTLSDGVTATFKFAKDEGFMDENTIVRVDMHDIETSLSSIVSKAIEALTHYDEL